MQNLLVRIMRELCLIYLFVSAVILRIGVLRHIVIQSCTTEME